MFLKYTSWEVELLTSLYLTLSFIHMKDFKTDIKRAIVFFQYIYLNKNRINTIWLSRILLREILMNMLYKLVVTKSKYFYYFIKKIYITIHIINEILFNRILYNYYIASFAQYCDKVGLKTC